MIQRFQRRSCFNFVLVWVAFVQAITCLQTELSVIIEAGKRECFNQQLIKELHVETDFQVIQGGELDISYWISSPSNRVIFTELRKQGSQFHFTSAEEGEYRFCFDNSFSRFANKQVFFYMATNESYTDPHFQPAKAAKVNVDKLGELEDKLSDFKDRFHRVYNNLERAQRLQNVFKAFEMIDRSLMEDSFDRVNFWSVVNISLMVCVGFIQVFMIRSLFEDRSKIGKLLRGDAR